jgi:mannose-1-phosphate guanylyltransferase
LATAQKYISQTNFYWNAGIFIWSATTIINAFRAYQPSIAKIFDSIRHDLGTDHEQAVIDERYQECESISVDYAIMEKADEIYVCPSSFGWSDLGTWGALLRESQHDLYGNTVIGEGVSLFDTRNSIIHTVQ